MFGYNTNNLSSGLIYVHMYFVLLHLANQIGNNIHTVCVTARQALTSKP